MSLLYIVILAAFVLIGIGFWCGWFVRGGEVKKLKETMNVTVLGVRYDIKPGDAVTTLEVQRQVRSQADQIVHLLDKARRR